MERPMRHGIATRVTKKMESSDLKLWLLHLHFHYEPPRNTYLKIETQVNK
ncbi:hypothetical protein Lalb_Chr19g0127021 [Lupinus albus]|uniref:Uncharacterized protein n=1 Tax=Lupinus albus TaxID=3870 RepID=A0A6A4NSS6_LUPAL|nr:hypothetical protein Lalb_Chr19g0127021 [Lupinus albus]